MNSKEALNELFNVAGCERCCCSVECEEQMDKYGCVMCEQWHQVIKQDLDKLEQLEKENQGVKDDNTRLWHGLEYGNNEISKLKQAIKILKDKIEFEDLGEMQSGNMYRGYFNDCLDEEEVNSLKQVFESVGEE